LPKETSWVGELCAKTLDNVQNLQFLKNMA